MTKLGRFEILEKIGQGAMGVVYKAHDPLIGRIVALKTLTTGLADDPNLLKRFYSEARAAGALQHPNIVTIYELGHDGQTPYIVMQFLDGQSLDKLISRNPNWPLAQRLGFIVYVCRALNHAHTQDPPIVHRDIKPGNVMVTTDGDVMVVDFGIARLGESTRSHSLGMLIGTLAYMAPQLFRGGSADARSDIWAAGVMLYELLAHRRPFQGKTPAALIANIIDENAPPITSTGEEIPPQVLAALDRMLCKDIDARFQSMEEVLSQLEPPWRRLSESQVANLVAIGRQQFEAGDVETAQEAINQALHIDTSNTQAKAVLEKINAEIRRNEVIPKLLARVEKARESFAAGQFKEALAEAEAMIRIDSKFQPARELFEQAQSAIERANAISKALQALRQRFVEGSLADAEIELEKVLALDSGNAEAQDLAGQIRRQKAQRELEARRAETLRRARNLSASGRYADCIKLLVSAQQEFPDDPEITTFLEVARLNEARILIDSNNFSEASAILSAAVFTQGDPQARSMLQEIEVKGSAVQASEPGIIGSAVEPVVGSVAQPLNPTAPWTAYEVPQQQTAIPDRVANDPDATLSVTAVGDPVNRIDPNSSPRGSYPGARDIPPPVPPIPENIPSPADRDAPWWENRWNQRLVGGTALILVLTISAVYFLRTRRNKIDPATPSVMALQTDSLLLRSQGKFDEASSKDQQIVQLDGGLASWARVDLEEMQKIRQQEAALIAEGKAAERQRDYRGARQFYRDALDLHGPQQPATQADLESVESLLNGEAAETVALKSFERGIESFGQRDYRAAQEIFRDCLNHAPETWPQRGEVQSYLTKIEARLAQLDSVQRAQTAFAAQQYDSAKNDATQSANLPDGDPTAKAAALELLRRIQGREQQRKIYDQAAALERAAKYDKAKANFDRVSSFPDGDKALAEKAKADALRMSDAMVKEIDEAIKQAKFDAADAKLAQIPGDHGDYSRLKAAILDGRKEDSLFAAKNLELEHAETAKDESALRAVREFFVAASSHPGRHAQHAAASVSRIDLDLKAIANSLIRADLDKIEQLKTGYKTGFQTRNPAVLRRIWPSITDKKLKEYDDAFKNSASVQWNLLDCTAPAFHGNEATFKCVQDIQIAQASADVQHRKDSVTFSLQKQQNDWTIKRIDTQKLKH